MTSLHNIPLEETFYEHILRLYLGKYAHRFQLENDGLTLQTITHPILVAQILKPSAKIALFEYIKIEEEDHWSGTFDFYCDEIIVVSIADPDGIKKIESAVARLLLAGTRA